MKLRDSAMFVLIFLVVGSLFAQDSGYKPGKIVSVTKKEAVMATGGTDAPTKSSTAA